MNSSENSSSRSKALRAWIQEARGGSKNALGRLSEECRQYLLTIAYAELDARLRSKLGGSDVVQQTLFEAFRDFDKFHGHDEEQLLAWLRQILLHNLANIDRHYFGTAKRELVLEVPLDETLAQDERLARSVTMDVSPERQAITSEEERSMLDAIEDLPPVMRHVILLHHQEGLSFPEVGERLNRSAEAARKLWVRAVKLLQTRLAPSDDASPQS
ncbi:MAG: sigma-70 family RNA polymerase sigma factor [Pirellulales bacterium]